MSKLHKLTECSCCGYPLTEDEISTDVVDNKVFNAEQFSNVNRIEVIDQQGRSYVHYLKNENLTYSVQDDGKTLKLFIDNKNK